LVKIFELKIKELGYGLDLAIGKKDLGNFFEKNYRKFENYAGDIEKFINYIKYEHLNIINIFYKSLKHIHYSFLDCFLPLRFLCVDSIDIELGSKMTLFNSPHRPDSRGLVKHPVIHSCIYKLCRVDKCDQQKKSIEYRQN
jgi:hypothetical protein